MFSPEFMGSLQGNGTREFMRHYCTLTRIPGIVCIVAPRCSRMFVFETKTTKVVYGGGGGGGGGIGGVSDDENDDNEVMMSLLWSHGLGMTPVEIVYGGGETAVDRYCVQPVEPTGDAEEVNSEYWDAIRWVMRYVGKRTEINIDQFSRGILFVAQKRHHRTPKPRVSELLESGTTERFRTRLALYREESRKKLSDIRAPYRSKQETTSTRSGDVPSSSSSPPQPETALESDLESSGPEIVITETVNE